MLDRRRRGVDGGIMREVRVRKEEGTRNVFQFKDAYWPISPKIVLSLGLLP